jgi:hypothetical protein
VEVTMKAMIVAVLLLAAPISIGAQPLEFRVSGGFGYQYGGIPAGSTNYEYISTPVGYLWSMNNIDDAKYTLGQGTRFDASVLYYLKENIAVFFGSGYSSGAAEGLFTYAGKSEDEHSYWTSSIREVSTLSFSNIPIVAGFQFNLPLGIVTPYAGIGGGIFIPGNIRMNYSYHGSNNSSWYNDWEHYWEEYAYDYNESIELKITTDKPFGTIAFVGISANVLPRISVFAEVKSTMVTFSMQKIELTKYNVNGWSQLQYLEPSDKTVIFKDKYEYSSSEVFNSNSPTFGGSPQPLSGNSIGLTFGLSIQI